MIANIERGEIVQGASTITQQVVKQLLLSPERTFERKAKELILAIELESKLSKNDILYLYVNHIYFGAGTYGISAAAQTLFGRDVADLSLAQAALLAGLPKAPSRTDPLRRPEAAISRQRYVLDRMASVGFITTRERDAALAEPLALEHSKAPKYTSAPWYVEHVRRLLEEQYGPELADLGLHVETAVDLRLQQYAEETLRDGLRAIERQLGRRNVVRHLPAERIDDYLGSQRQSRTPEGPQQAVVTRIGADSLDIRTPWESAVVPKDGLGTGPERRSSSTFRVGDVISVDPIARDEDGVMQYTLDLDPQVEGALIVIEPETGLVKALVGGVDFRRSQFNRAVLARRQPGSAFKPFIYAAAIDPRLHRGVDRSGCADLLPGGRRGMWSPKNFRDKCFGPDAAHAR
jgi:penicillin-binding protein 1A